MHPAPQAPQLVTLTVNPALDITTDVDTVRPTDKMRCGPARYDPGGGGINVARVAHALGTRACAVFPAGGVTGGLLTELLDRAQVRFRRVPIAEPTRESFTVNESRSGQQFRFVLPGPVLSGDEQAACLRAVDEAARTAPYVVASGSLPPGVDADFYQVVGDVCAHTGARFVLDTSGRGLTHITSGVFLLKASVRELRDCSGGDLTTDVEQVAAARALIDGGRAEIVVVSRGGDGALLVTGHSSHHFPAVPVAAGSGVGAGDAMVAGIVVGLTRGWDLGKAVRLGIAAGAAMLLTPGTATCTRADVERIFDTAPEPTVIR
ncbi:1-phosphofructokinase family hexose kinase [Mycobacterium sp. GA-2829]|uniref:1-phosphofructokinase family hexose kinase n=1 Tax=Mycobacterium sp. GA-2829 TaxID=1772283 RepID=UPI000740324E|nr:1-phosphofructokinase family hexose kinase [Mycobacterium sp. GA-2829]KUI32764.1 phosphofructokinase [Mycobacterium sp. GA-2829]